MQSLFEMISKQDMGRIFENIHAMLALVERDGRLISWNAAFGACQNISLPATTLAEMFPQNYKSQIPSMLNKNSLEHALMEFSLSDNTSPSLCDCFFIPTADGRVLFIAERAESDSAFQELIEQLKGRIKLFQIESDFTKKLARNKQIEMEAVMAQAREVAAVDPLTFLLNRRMILRELQDEVLRAERYKSLLSISVVDVDHFKLVNDTYGHLVGDEVLRVAAAQLRDSVRQPDLVGRYGGEEFLILLPSSDENAAAEQAERLCKHVRETGVRVKEHEVKVTISVGATQFRHGVDTWDTLLNRADNAMYEAKANGRDGWVIAK